MIDRSDFMLKTNIESLQFRHISENDKAFDYQMSRTAPRCFVDRAFESRLLNDNYKVRTPYCDGCTANRGGNHPGCEIYKSCPHPEYSKYYLGEFLMVPCPKPTYKNYIVCDTDKCCSKRHQLFKNLTKRKDIASVASAPLS